MASIYRKKLDELNEQIARSGMAEQLEPTSLIKEDVRPNVQPNVQPNTEKITRPKERLSLIPQSTTPLAKAKEERAAVQEQAPIPSTFETSMADMVRKQEEDLAQQRAERDKLQQEIMAARDAEGSFVANWFRQNEPKYDAEAEKRAKQAARIKAIGEALGLVASGFAAFGNNGMGYVPKFESSALKDIEKINETREKYLAQREAWKEFDYKQRLASLQARTKAAEALKEAKDKDIEDTEAQLQDYEKMMQKHLSDKELAAIKAEQALEKQSQGHTQRMEQIGKRTEGAIAEQNAKQAKEKEEQEVLGYAAVADMVEPFVVETEVTDKYGRTKKTTKKGSPTHDDNLKRGKAFKESWKGKLYEQVKAEGATTEDAVDIIKDVINLIGKEGLSQEEAIAEVLDDYKERKNK